VVVEHFLVGIADEERSEPEYLASWDYGTSLDVTAHVAVNLRACLSDIGVSSDAILGLCMTWQATGSGLRGASEVVPIRDGVNTVAMSFDGPELGGTLVIQIVLTLIRGSTDADVLSPRRPGSLLWSSERRVRLEGQGSRFPISYISFAESGLVDGLCAAWTLMFESSDLYDSGLGNMRLYLNTDHPGIKDLMAAGTDGDGPLDDVLHADVNRQLVLQALDASELDLATDYPTDSLGELLSMSVRRNFPDRTLDEVRGLAKTSPGEFEAHLQARGGFLL
jgi:hypothetical protein